jgi:hypothetical protein
MPKMPKSLLVILGFLVALPTVGLAGTLISICGKKACDPNPAQIVNPIPITPSSIQTVQPTGNAQETDYAFINLTGTVLDNFVFDVQINPGLDETPIAAKLLTTIFPCPAGSNDYFLHCSVTYNDTTGVLAYSYFGVNPPETGLAGIADSVANEVGEQEGIPACTLGLWVCQNLEGGRGIFTIGLTGWTKDLSAGDPTTIYSGLPKFTSAFNVPEPSAALILLTELLLLAGVLTAFGRRLNWKRRFDL